MGRFGVFKDLFARVKLKMIGAEFYPSTDVMEVILGLTQLELMCGRNPLKKVPNYHLSPLLLILYSQSFMFADYGSVVVIGEVEGKFIDIMQDLGDYILDWCTK